MASEQATAVPADVAVRGLGVLAVVAGAAGVVAHPLLYMLSDNFFQAMILEVWIASALGAIALTWGVFAAATGEWRPFTPARALVIPVVQAAHWTLVHLIPVPQIERAPHWTTDQLFPVPQLGALDVPLEPITLPEVVAALTTMPTGGVVGGSMLAGLGVAVARDQQWWGAVAAGLALAVALNMGRQSGHPVAAVLLVAAFGIIPFAVGYALAVPRCETP